MDFRSTTRSTVSDRYALTSIVQLAAKQLGYFAAVRI